MRQAAHRFLESGQAFRRREAAQRVAHLGKPLLQPCERRAVAAGLPAAVDALGERAHLRLERLDRAARHRLGQRPADLGEIVAQRGERVLVGLLQRGDLSS